MAHGMAHVADIGITTIHASRASLVRDCLSLSLLSPSPSFGVRHARCLIEETTNNSSYLGVLGSFPRLLCLLPSEGAVIQSHVNNKTLRLS